ncbi:hypothetical protein GN330_07920 [Nitratireductor sp. CAU 1489]|uniref:Uncharacterized protein n=1 Tax=Nitratireductor arenosus TaxID=2682096 RepID=A0A844QGL7_9HYPH|nr:hypothetical protein [Nitratireductor arenosus]MVA97173.1 hypothetical protein [Nitratireductor arenosus]
MTTNVQALARALARDRGFSDYDFWRAKNNLENAIHAIAGRNEPIPIDYLRWRAVVRQARDIRRAV